MRVRSPELGRLTQVLQSIPVAYRQQSYDSLVIDGATPEWLGPLLAQHQIVVYELNREGGALEDVFLSLTSGFDAAPPGSAGPPMEGAGRQPDPAAAGWLPPPPTGPPPGVASTSASPAPPEGQR